MPQLSLPHAAMSVFVGMHLWHHVYVIWCHQNQPPQSYASSSPASIHLLALFVSFVTPACNFSFSTWTSAHIGTEVNTCTNTYIHKYLEVYSLECIPCTWIFIVFMWFVSSYFTFNFLRHKRWMHSVGV